MTNVPEIVAGNIATIYSKEQSDKFLLLPEVQAVSNSTNELPETYQMVSINRAFSSVLLKYASDSKESVSEAITCLLPDGNLTEWVTLLNTAVIPYMKLKNISF